MQMSQRVAAAVALRELGYKVDAKPIGARIEFVDAGVAGRGQAPSRRHRHAGRREARDRRRQGSGARSARAGPPETCSSS